MLERISISLPEMSEKTTWIQRQFSINEHIYIYSLARKRRNAEINPSMPTCPKSIWILQRLDKHQLRQSEVWILSNRIWSWVLFFDWFYYGETFLNTKIEDPKEIENQHQVPFNRNDWKNTSENAQGTSINNPRSTWQEIFQSTESWYVLLGPNRKNLASSVFTTSISAEVNSSYLTWLQFMPLMGKKKRSCRWFEKQKIC